MAKRAQRVGDHEIQERRTQIARAMVTMERPSIRRIADRLGINRGTVHEDIKAIRAEWKELRLRDWEEHLDEELAKLDLEEQELWIAWQRSKENFERTQTATREVTVRAIDAEDNRIELPATEVTVTRMEHARLPDPRYMDALLKCQDRRARLLGLNAQPSESDQGAPGHVYAFTLQVENTVHATFNNDREILEALAREAGNGGPPISVVGADGKKYLPAELLEPDDDENST